MKGFHLLLIPPPVWFGLCLFVGVVALVSGVEKFRSPEERDYDRDNLNRSLGR